MGELGTRAALLQLRLNNDKVAFILNSIILERKPLIVATGCASTVTLRMSGARGGRGRGTGVAMTG